MSRVDRSMFLKRLGGFANAILMDRWGCWW